MFSYGRTRIRAEFQQQSFWIPVGPGVHSGLLLHFEEKAFLLFNIICYAGDLMLPSSPLLHLQTTCISEEQREKTVLIQYL